MKRGLLILTLLLLIPALAFPAWVKQTSETGRNLRAVWHWPWLTMYLQAVAVGDSGTILMTTNNGSSWVPRTSPTRQTLNGASYDPNDFIIRPWVSVVGGDSAGVILLSTDGGNTWGIQASPPTVMNSVSFGDSLRGWAVGRAGAIWRTTDGGFSWSFQANPLAVNWNGVCFANSQMGWVCGGIGTIMRTTNGGATWATQASGTSVTLRGVSFMNSNIGVVVGDSGKIFSTTDGGLAWTPASSGVTDDLFGVFWLGGFLGFAVGANGSIIRSSWDRSTWAPDTSGTTRNLRGVNYFFIPDGGVFTWAVGDSGTILYLFIPTGGVELSPASHLTPYSSHLTVSPNPFVSFASVPGHESERFALYDISGRKVGVYQGDRIGERLPPGVYFLWEAGGRSPLTRIVKVR